MAQADAAVFKFFGETIGFWIQTGAFVFSAFYAARQVRMLRLQTEQNEQQARRRATVDMVLHERQDPHFLDARKLFASLRDKKVNLTQFACEDSSKNPVENAAIMRILNHYEFMAAGICEGAFDEAMYKRMKKSLVIADWHALSGYALEMRKHSGVKALFCEFERLATCWENHRPARLSP